MYVVFTIMSRVDVILRSVCFLCDQFEINTNVLCPTLRNSCIAFHCRISLFLIKAGKKERSKHINECTYK